MKSTLIKSTIVLLLITVFGCKNADKKEETASSIAIETNSLSEEEMYRPNFHFTPKIGWMNDPNGMFFYNGYYHLYFQHYPDSSVWGPMHWGHAISTDMVSWKEQSIALYPDELGYIFSGSTVVDYENTSGFGKDGKTPIVAIYTSHDPKKAKEGKIDVETQSIAYSLDEGLTWTKFVNNPVLKNQGVRDFRDPKVSWDEQHKRWTMVLAAGQEIRFYTSKDLKGWELLSTFGEGVGNHDGVWECPDFFKLPVRDTDENKWVLLVSINPGGPNGGSASQYFVGDFDGTNFVLDNSFKEAMAKEHSFWVDHGRDNYAGVTWSNVATTDGGRLHIGWMSNWMYANKVPTHPWRSATTIARELRLKKGNDTYRLVSEPVAELEGYRGVKFKNEAIAISQETTLIDSKKIDLSRAEINFNISAIQDKSFSFKISNRNADELFFGYNHKDNNFYIDRTKSGRTGFSKEFADRITTASRTSNAENLKGTILLDKTSIEIFYDAGETVMTEVFFPNTPYETLSIHSENKDFILDNLEIHELNFN